MLRVKLPTIAAHGIAVAELTGHLSRALGLTAKEHHLAIVAALLHDVGKVYVSENVLFKRGALNRGEFAELRAHALAGEVIVLEATGQERLARVVGQHHERIDGGGYPRGLYYSEIDPVARIVSVADAYVAMREERPYSRARAWNEAANEILRNGGTQFDVDVTAVFERLVA